MEISQFSFVLLAVYSVCFGVILGVIYDVIRIQRIVLGAEYGDSTKGKINYRNIELPIIKKKAYSVKFEKISKKFLDIYIGIGDVLFVTLCGAAVVLVAYAYNSGRVRAVIFLGLLVGFFAYYFTVGKLIVKLAGLIGFVLRSFLIYLYEIIVAPIKLVLRLIKKRDRGQDVKERRKNDKREKQKLRT